VCEGPSYLAIAHVRDQLIAPAERQEKAQTWDQVVQYIRHKESRVREEIQHIAGDEFRLVSTTVPGPALHSRCIMMLCHIA
jgi:hypothetical protein